MYSNEDKLKFERVLNDAQKYRLYAKEARLVLRNAKNFLNSIDNLCKLGEQFYSSLICLCTCKQDNLPLTNLGKNISNLNTYWIELFQNFNYRFLDLNLQLYYINDQFHGIEKLKHGLNCMQKVRLKLELRKKRFTFWCKLFGSNNRFSKLALDQNLIKLKQEEQMLQRVLLNQCLNHELAIVNHIRKLCKKFSHNQVQLANDLNNLFTEFDLSIERDLPEIPVSLELSELEQYFRPTKIDLNLNKKKVASFSDDKLDNHQNDKQLESSLKTKISENLDTFDYVQVQKSMYETSKNNFNKAYSANSYNFNSTSSQTNQSNDHLRPTASAPEFESLIPFQASWPLDFKSNLNKTKSNLQTTKSKSLYYINFLDNQINDNYSKERKFCKNCFNELVENNFDLINLTLNK